MDLDFFKLEPPKPIEIEENKIDKALIGFGSLIRDRRREMKLTSTELAIMINTSRGTLEGFERGLRPNISFHTFLKICYTLNIDLFKEAESKAFIDEMKQVMLHHNIN